MAASMTSFSRYLKPNDMYFSLIDFCYCFTKTVIVLDVNECLNNPCKNGGTCYNNEASYHCVCPTGWTGQNCKIGKYLL